VAPRAQQFLLELPAGRIEPGEKLIPPLSVSSSKRPATARRSGPNTPSTSPARFLTEAMNILLAEDLTLGEANPEDDEKIEVRMTPLSEVLRLIHDGKIHDGKTLIGVLLYASILRK